MKLPSSLIELSKAFPTTLYVVGGGVRNHFLGLPVLDFDLASSLTPAQVISFIKQNLPNFKVSLTSDKMGTLRITHGKEYFEYTCFREDSYGSDGRHIPLEVKFSDSIEKDSFRRDFTINAIYYDINNGEYIDITGGLEDIKNKVIKTTRDPDTVLNEDALRILRMVRFSSSFGFSIEDATCESAKRNVSNLANIAKERIRDEFEKIIVADTIADIKGAHVEGLCQLMDLDAIQYIIPELTKGKGVLQRPDFHKYDVLDHIIKVYEASPSSIRLAALFHDIAKPYQLEKNGRMHNHDSEGGMLVASRMKALRYPNKEVERVRKLVENHMFDKDGKTSEKKVRIFIRKHHSLMNDLIELRWADIIGSGTRDGYEKEKDRLWIIYQEMKASNVPFTNKQLKITGKDLIEIGIAPKDRGKAIEDLLNEGSHNYSVHSRKNALAFLKRYI